MSDDDIPEPDRAEGAPHPRRTAQLFGQAAAEAAFLDARRAGRLHHAWLLAGPRGVGKATLAWRIARHMVAHGLTPAADLALDPDHPVMRRSTALAEPAIALVRRGWDDRAKRLRTQITVDEVRRLKGFFGLSVPGGGWRAVIIDAADEMNPQAANALLKVLEEPPERTILLLVSHQPSLILPTIRSRCRLLPLAALAPDALAQAVAAAGFEAGPDDAALLAVLSAGSAGAAVRMLDDGGIAAYRDLAALLEGLPQIDRARALALCGTGRDTARADMLATLATLLLSRAALAAVHPARAGLLPEESRAAARLAPDAAAARRLAAAIPDMAERAARARAVNLDPELVILDMLTGIERTARQPA
jgi:DNA polymerase-3 subunit delta'